MECLCGFGCEQRSGGSDCTFSTWKYERQYTKEHLIKVPKQKIERIRLEAQKGSPEEGIDIKVSIWLRKAREPMYFFGVCAFEEARLSCDGECDSGQIYVEFSAEQGKPIARIRVREAGAGFHPEDYEGTNKPSFGARKGSADDNFILYFTEK